MLQGACGVVVPRASGSRLFGLLQHQVLLQAWFQRLIVSLQRRDNWRGDAWACDQPPCDPLTLDVPIRVTPPPHCCGGGPGAKRGGPERQRGLFTIGDQSSGQLFRSGWI